MAVNSKHPLWTDRRSDWALARDASRGEAAIKMGAETYLPKPSGMKFHPVTRVGDAMYEAYMLRAQFPDILLPTLRGMVGVIHRHEADIEMPTSMEFIWEKATKDGIPLETFHQRITSEILLMGRYGLLVEAPTEEDGGGDPYMTGWPAERIINWGDERDFFMLDESGPVRNRFDWRDQRRYRELALEDGTYVQRVYESDSEDSKVGADIMPRRAGGNGRLDRIPFVVAGPRDLSLDVDEPPLIGVARAALAIYRLDADYRHQLYSTGQETLFVFNGQAPEVVGAGVIVSMSGDAGVDLDAKFVGPAGVGIEAHRKAIEDERRNAAASGARLFEEQQGGPAESGTARGMRYTAQTATLATISRSSAAALEQALRHVGRFMGMSEDEVEKIIVKGNTEFVDATMTPQDASALVTAWQAGAISKLTLFENLQNGGLISPEREFEEEQDLIEAGIADIPALNPPADPNDDTMNGGGS